MPIKKFMQQWKGEAKKRDPKTQSRFRERPTRLSNRERRCAVRNMSKNMMELQATKGEAEVC